MHYNICVLRIVNEKHNIIFVTKNFYRKMLWISYVTEVTKNFNFHVNVLHILLSANPHCVKTSMENIKNYIFEVNKTFLWKDQHFIL